jgi:hypothetical protein
VSLGVVGMCPGSGRGVLGVEEVSWEWKRLPVSGCTEFAFIPCAVSALYSRFVIKQKLIQHNRPLETEQLKHF